jgi:hypothetical protein
VSPKLRNEVFIVLHPIHGLRLQFARYANYLATTQTRFNRVKEVIVEDAVLRSFPNVAGAQNEVSVARQCAYLEKLLAKRAEFEVAPESNRDRHVIRIERV